MSDDAESPDFSRSSSRNFFGDLGLTEWAMPRYVSARFNKKPLAHGAAPPETRVKKTSFS